MGFNSAFKGLMSTVGDRHHCSNQQVLRRMSALSEHSTYCLNIAHIHTTDIQVPCLVHFMKGAEPTSVRIIYSNLFNFFVLD